MNLRILPLCSASLCCAVLLAFSACSKAGESQNSPATAPVVELPKPEETVLTYDNFNRLHPGMTEAQVRQILGKPSDIDAQVVKGSDQRIIYTYRNDAQTCSITVNFTNGALDSKSCDLKETPKSNADGVPPQP